MASLPQPEHTTARAVFELYEARRRQRLSDRPTMGGSDLGKECDRAVWYSFRWCTPDGFPGRILRLFETGNIYETRMIEELRDIGVELHTSWPPGSDGQIEFTALGGHLTAHLDGIGRGFPEAPDAWHVWDAKSMADKKYKEFVNKGLAVSHPQYIVQMMVYMHLSGVDRAVIEGTNKNTDEIHSERIRYSAREGDALLERASRIIASDNPPERISQDPAWYQCKFCDHHSTCHSTRVPPASCRTCLHATPERNGNAAWSCAHWHADIPLENQEAGCAHHSYIPALLASWARPEDANAAGVEYINELTGHQFTNGAGGHETDRPAYTSVELAAATDLKAIGEPGVDQLRKTFGARVEASPAMLAEGETLEWKEHDAGKHLGLYRCGHWVKWVPQTPEWLALAPLPMPAACPDVSDGLDDK